MKFILTAIGIMLALFMQTNCGETQKEKLAYKPDKPVTTITTVLIAFNIGTNDYRGLTAQRTVKDSLKIVVTDSTDGKIIQEKKWVSDTSYNVWWAFNVMDSAKKNVLKTTHGQDSVMFKWVPCESAMIVQDFNKNYK